MSLAGNRSCPVNIERNYYIQSKLLKQKFYESLVCEDLILGQVLVIVINKKGETNIRQSCFSNSILLMLAETISLRQEVFINELRELSSPYDCTPLTEVQCIKRGNISKIKLVKAFSAFLFFLLVPTKKNTRNKLITHFPYSLRPLTFCQR